MLRDRLFAPVRSLRFRHASLLASCVLLFGVVLVFFINSLSIPYIDKSFSYSADLQTSINTFDKTQNRFTGGQYGLTTFSIEQLKRVDGTAYLKNTTQTSFYPANTKTSSSQSYTVQTKNGQHIDAAGNAAGYLFGPQNVRRGASYTLWYAVYDRSVPMQYAGEESINGLTTYVYTASFNEADYLTRADVVEPLVYRPKLRLWIEPTSGWLVKYQEENTTFDINDSSRTPLSFTTSISSDASIAQHVAYAKQLKYRLDLGLYVAPGILLIALLIAIFVLILKIFGVRSLPIETTAAFILALSTANIIGWVWDITALRSLLPNDVAISPLASVCFMIIAISLVLLYRKKYRRLVLGCGIAVIAIATLALLYRASIIAFDVRDVLFSSTITTADKGISLFGTLVFYLLGFGLIKTAYTEKNRGIIAATKLIVGIAACLGLAGLLGKILLLDQLFVVPFVTVLSISGSLLSTLCGLCLLQILLIRFPYANGHRQPLFKALLKPAVLTLPLLIIGVFAQLQQNAIAQHIQADFDKQASALQTTISDTLTSYTNTLVGAQALFGSSMYVEKNEWQSYIGALSITKNLPGVQGVGYAPITRAADLPALAQKMNTPAIGQNYTVFPAGMRESYTPIIYIEPATQSNLRTLGFDMATDPNRQNTMTIATRTGTPSLSAKANLIQETTTEAETGFFLFLPVFAHNLPLSTIEERQKAIEGYIYAPFNANTFFTHALRKTTDGSGIKLSIYDGIQKDASSLLFAYQPTGTDSTEHLVLKTETLAADNRLWTFVYESTSAFDQQADNRNTPSLILVGGGLSYIIVLVLYSWFTSVRQQALQNPNSENRKQKKV